jgi:hypothetical protein
LSARIRDHIRSNVVGYIALFFALSTGSAFALSGSNTVFSDDIVDDQVRTADVRDDTLAGGGLSAADLRPGSVGTSEVAADSLGAGDLAAGSVGSSEVANDSLTGSDIVEASLGSVGSANFAGDSALLDGFDSSEFLSTSSGGTVNGSVTLNTAAGADLELGEATLFRNSGTNETFTMNNPGAGDLNLFVGGQITASGYINFPTISGAAPPSTDCDDASEAGRAVVRIDGATNLYVCRGAAGWIGK